MSETDHKFDPQKFAETTKANRLPDEIDILDAGFYLEDYGVLDLAEKIFELSPDQMYDLCSKTEIANYGIAA